ncbi:MAG: MGH1-like glycoside hydrolase domain-containing protein, partial [Candidatus Dormibacteraceae bacterium]
MHLPQRGRNGELAAAAQAVLQANDAGRWTLPSPAQYPHQWNWDSAFISLGWATFNWERACTEIESMLHARWREGMVPQIHYDPRYLANYFPGPDRWPRAQAHILHGDESTSGITNPPVLISSVLRIGRSQTDLQRRHSFWRRTFPHLRDWLEYFAKSRQLAGSPLIAMVHPWESGCDNSPRWDHLSAAGLKPKRPFERLDTRHVSATQRPSNRDYDSYIALAEMLDACDYDVATYRANSPFCVYDVLIDALWYRAASDLNEIAGELQEPSPFDQGRLREFAAAFEETHWDKELGLYVDWDCVANGRIRQPTIAGLVSLMTQLVDRTKARAIWQCYEAMQAQAVSVCTVPTANPAFDRSNYWRGQVWL